MSFQHSIFMFDLGQSDLMSHKSMSLSGVFRKAGEVCSFGDLWLAPVCQSGPIPALIIFQTQFHRGLLSAAKTLWVRSNQIKLNKLFLLNKFAITLLEDKNT